ncbi:MAG TPA: peptidoglycan-binding domain-containing protein [Terriglobia bacterium]|nr:peptidoglycan-binding domain-containing protein [Terriglobia bacterium]
MPDHTVEAGECISSIAFEEGFFWETIWNHPQNASLQQQRKDPNILFPGDVVFVPEKQVKQEIRSSGAHYKFVKKNSLVTLRLRLLDDFHARAGVKYVLIVGSLSFSGQTDSQGHLSQKIPANATSALLLTDEDAYNLNLGVLDPITEDLGVQHRLRNLGYLGQDTDGVITDSTTAALAKFQKEHGLEDTGELTDATRATLQQVHGC